MIVTHVSTGKTAFRLAPRRFGRVKHFFEGIAYEAYRKANGYIRKELERLGRELPLLASDDDREMFFRLARVRESSVVFSDPRVLRAESDLKTVIEMLYDRFIGRNFVGTENAESNLTKRLRKSLHDRGVKHFKTLRINDDVVPVTFPLAYRAEEIFAIKPLAFSQKSPLHVFDHGTGWKNRLSYLLERNKIRPHNILLALDPPTSKDEAFVEAFELAKSELKELPFDFANAANEDGFETRLFDFIERSPMQDVWIRH